MVDRDAATLLEAAQRYADASRPLPRAKALEAAAECLVEVEDRTGARLAFEQAVEVYEFLGAEADLNRVQAEFRGYGIRRGPHSKHRRAQSGWESLTDAELKVAAFVEEGLSNPEIAARLMLSRRTVATHVSHILKKLDVATRTDIARESGAARPRLPVDPPHCPSRHPGLLCCNWAQAHHNCAPGARQSAGLWNTSTPSAHTEAL